MNKEQWIGFITGNHWGPEFDDREAPKLKQNKINSNCTIFVDRMIPFSLNYEVKNRIALVCEPAFVTPGVREWLLKNKQHFSKIIELDNGFDFSGEVWIENKQIYSKTKNISAVFSNKFNSKVEGYSLRKQIAFKFKNLIDFYGTIALCSFSLPT